MLNTNYASPTSSLSSEQNPQMASRLLGVLSENLEIQMGCWNWKADRRQANHSGLHDQQCCDG